MLSHRVDDLLVVISIEWRNGCHQDVKDYSERPYVASLVVATFDYLWGKVIWLD